MRARSAASALRARASSAGGDEPAEPHVAPRPPREALGVRHAPRRRRGCPAGSGPRRPTRRCRSPDRGRRPRARASAAARRSPRPPRAARRRARRSRAAATLSETAIRSRPGGRRGRLREGRSAVLDRVVEQRRVGHRAGQRPDDRQPVPGLGPRRHRDAVALRLEPEQPAARGRDADRAARRPSRAPRRPAPRRPPPPVPPLDPPGVRCRSHGLRVAPYVGVSVNGRW